MGKKLYVGNLPSSITDETLQQIFAQVGTVESVKIITDRYTGVNRGFGFVEMTSNQEAADAISKLNGTDCQGKALTVAEARPQTSGGGDDYRRDTGSKRGPRW